MYRTRRRLLVGAGVATCVWLATSGGLHGHCQIPCGIYDDPVRFRLLDEHIRTIEKSMTQIRALSAAPDKNANQLVRWVKNKDEHADKFARIVTAYFLQQRIKPDGADNAAYVHKLVLCHRMLVTVMKAKQTTDSAHTNQLRTDLAAFRKAYVGAEKASGEHGGGHGDGGGHGHAH
jgi:nickel superoxide dismutase